MGSQNIKTKIKTTKNKKFSHESSAPTLIYFILNPKARTNKNIKNKTKIPK
jgi:hypothetical protein